MRHEALVAGVSAGRARIEISPYEHIAAIPPSVPVVIIAGSADRHARLDEVKAMAGRVRSGANWWFSRGRRTRPGSEGSATLSGQLDGVVAKPQAALTLTLSRKERGLFVAVNSMWRRFGGFAIIPPVRLVPRLLVVFALGGCAGTLAGRLTLPNRDTLVRDQLVIHSDFPVAADHRLFEELTSQRTDLCRRLSLPRSDEPIHVYLFESAERFDGFIKLHYPQFPDRRAFFVETDDKLAIYVRWGDRMADDLRHEVTHAYLHAVVPNMPQWLDEGIAKYYEVSAEPARGESPAVGPHASRGSSASIGSPTCSGSNGLRPITT